MVFRDDLHAVQARVDALERENAQLRAELDTLRAGPREEPPAPAQDHRAFPSVFDRGTNVAYCAMSTGETERRHRRASLRWQSLRRGARRVGRALASAAPIALAIVLAILVAFGKRSGRSTGRVT